MPLNVLRKHGCVVCGAALFYLDDSERSAQGPSLGRRVGTRDVLVAAERAAHSRRESGMYSFMVERTMRRFGLGALAAVVILGAVYGVRVAMRADAEVDPAGFRVEPRPVSTDAVLPDDALFKLRECVQECLDRGLATMKPSSGVLRYSPGTFYRLSLNAADLRRSLSTCSGDAAAKPLEDLIEALSRVAGVDAAIDAAIAARAANRGVPESR